MTLQEKAKIMLHMRDTGSYNQLRESVIVTLCGMFAISRDECWSRIEALC